MNGIGTAASFKTPKDVKYVNGALLVSGDSLVRKIDLSTGVVTSIASTTPVNAAGSYAGVAPTLSVDASGSIYTVDAYSGLIGKLV